MNRSQAHGIIGAVVDWAIGRDDVRAMALVGSWARGNPSHVSDFDLLVLTDRTEEYRRHGKWLSEIDFGNAGFRIQSSESAVYGVVCSHHIHLLPTAEVEMTFANCSWARTDPIDGGTRRVVKDAFRIIFDKDGTLDKLIDIVMSGNPP